jgi:DNA-binding response OmpR family regulator
MSRHVAGRHTVADRHARGSARGAWPLIRGWYPSCKPERFEMQSFERDHKRIVVAEDDPDLRHLITLGLQMDGREVVEVADGGDLFTLLAATLGREGEPSPFDVIVSDVRMPGWSGLEVLAGLQLYAEAPPVVLITGFGDDELHAEARRLGAVATLDKPFDIDHLRAVIAALVLRRPAPAAAR